MVKNCDAKKNLKVFIEEQYITGKKYMERKEKETQKPYLSS